MPQNIYELLLWGTIGSLLLALLWHVLVEFYHFARWKKPRVDEGVSVEIAQRMLSEGVESQELLFKAVRNNEEKTVLFLLASGAFPDAIGEVASLNRRCCALEYAATLSGNALISAMLLRAGARTQTVNGLWTPLHLAAVSGGRMRWRPCLSPARKWMPAMHWGAHRSCWRLLQMLRKWCACWWMPVQLLKLIVPLSGTGMSNGHPCCLPQVRVLRPRYVSCYPAGLRLMAVAAMNRRHSCLPASMGM